MDSMRFQVLGPVRAWRGGDEVDLGSPKLRLLCGALLLEVNRFVSVDALSEILWPDGPPVSARRTVQAYVSRLRATLVRPADATARVAVVRRGSGYRLACDPELVDAHRFRRLVEEARGVADPEAARLLREALGLWQGPPLADVADDELRIRHWRGLVDARLAAVEDLAEVELRLGLHERLVEDLAVAGAQHPYRQRLIATLMLALHRCGRTAEALKVFDETRRRLADELGIDPSAGLQEAHLAILRDEPPVDGPRASRSAGADRPVPAQLPADTADFIGREAELRQLDRLAETAGSDGSATVMPIAVVSGTAGVGKTALAIHWGHRVRHRLADGQLYVNLRGFSAEAPRRPIEVLTRFLLALGCPSDQAPVETEPAADAYRTLLADRRMLVVLDNAHDADQVRPLLPGSAGCVVVVTSRSSLGGLVAGHGARRLQLDVLPAPDAEQLLKRVVGADRTDAEPAAAVELVRLCARLPLALRIVAANLVDRPWESLSHHVAALRDDDRMAALAVEGDEQMAVQNALGHSYRAMPAPTRRMFRLLGLVIAHDVPTPAAAALAATTPRRAAALLGELAAAHLLQQHAPSRYWFHDLLRLYAVQRVEAEETEAGRRAAFERLLWWYECTAAAAAAVLYPHRLRLPPALGVPASARPAAPLFAGPAEATAWFDAERSNLVLMVEQAAASGPQEVAWRLADTLRGYFWLSMHTVDWLTVGAAGLAAAQAGAPPEARAAARFNLGDALVRQSRYRDAAEHFEQALLLAEQVGWTPMRSAALGSLGSVYLNAGEPRIAEGHLLGAIELARQAGTRFSEAVLLGGLGVAYRELGRLEGSVEAFDEAVKVFAECGVRQGEMAAVSGLGETYHAMGRLDLAADCFTRALSVFRGLGDRSGESDVLPGLAAVEGARGRIEVARDLATTAWDLALEINDRRAVANARNVLGSIHHRAGQYAEAAEQYRAVLHLTAETSDRNPQITAEIGLAAAYHRLGRPDLALPHARKARERARRSGYRLLEQQAARVLADLG